NGNAYHRTSPKNPERFACWANGKKGTESFPTLTTFRNATGQDRNSTVVEGVPINATGLLGRLATSPVARSLPARVARVTGQPAGVRVVGSFSSALG
ncbi:right-handed parallel beta-helix repeat-containing protein, partial [Aeromicrobium sp. zg-636]